MKYRILLIVTLCLLTLLGRTSAQELDSLKNIPWEHSEQNDSWLKIGFEGDNEIIIMLEKVIIRDFSLNELGKTVRFSISTRCGERHETEVVEWVAGETSGRHESCGGIKASVSIPQYAEKSFAPFPEEVRKILKKAGRNKNDLDL